MSDTDSTAAVRAQEMAEDMAARAFDFCPRPHFWVLSEKPPALAFRWRRKNHFGATFERSQKQEAIAWITAALAAGYTTFFSTRKSGWGTGNKLAGGGQ